MHSVEVIKKEVKNISLKVKPTCEVTLTVPFETDEKYIAHILKKREAWIEQKIAFFQSYKQEHKKEYVSGESFKYLGKSYRLKVIASEHESVKLLRGYIQLFVKNRDNYEKKEQLLNAWYRAKAFDYFSKIVEQYAPIVQKEVTSLKIRQMKSRWGSCNPSKGYINLNCELIKKPRSCIEYVIFHELAHLVHDNHSRAFYNYLNTYMPDWKKRKERLEA